MAMINRRGYALLATLWICVGIGALTFLISVSARETMASSRNRMAFTRAAWLGQACLAYGREALRDAFTQETATRLDSSRTLWSHLDRVLAEAPRTVAGCTLSAQVVGSRLDVNATDEATLRRVLRVAGMAAAKADSTAAAITQWIKTKGRFVDQRELHRVPGLDSLERLDSILGVEPGPLALNQAPRELLALLPGFTDHTVREVLDARARGEPIMTFHELTPWLDRATPDASAKLPGLILLTPTAWVVTARTRNGTPPVTAVIEVRLSRAGHSTSITRRRSWLE